MNRRGYIDENFIGFLIAATVCGSLIWWIVTFSWRGAEVEARVYNEKFGTSYQARDFFYGGVEIKKLWEQKIPNRANQNVLEGELTVNLKK